MGLLVTQRDSEKLTIAIGSQSLSFHPPQLHQHPESLVCARDFRVNGDDIPLVPLSVLVVLVKIVIIDLHGIQWGGGSRTSGHVVAFVIDASCSLGRRGGKYRIQGEDFWRKEYLEAYGAPLG